jgi:hypothetical protein
MTATTILDRPVSTIPPVDTEAVPADRRPARASGSQPFDSAGTLHAFLFPPLERSTEPLSAVLARTAHLLDEDHGDVACDHCGDHRSIGRRAGDPLYRCLPGYGCNA